MSGVEILRLSSNVLKNLQREKERGEHDNHSGDDIGVDYRNAIALETVGDRRFTATNSSCYTHGEAHKVVVLNENWAIDRLHRWVMGVTG